MNWWHFMESLDVLTRRHVKYQKGRTGRTELVSPVFASCFAPVRESVPKAFFKLGDAILDASCISCSKADAFNDEYTLRQLHFFIPVFIWAFFEVKKCIIDSMARIKMTQTSIEENMELLEQNGDMWNWLRMKVDAALAESCEIVGSTEYDTLYGTAADFRRDRLELLRKSRFEEHTRPNYRKVGLESDDLGYVRKRRGSSQGDNRKRTKVEHSHRGTVATLPSDSALHFSFERK